MFVLFWMLVCSTRDELMKLPNNEQIVFLGNSHIECSVNDTIVKNSFNFARSAEKMEFIYSKVKLLDIYNPQIDTIIIGYDNVIFRQRSDTTFAPILYSPYFFDTYDIDDIFEIFKSSSFGYIENHITHPFNWLKLYELLSPFYLRSVNITKLNNIGGYLYLKRDKLNEDIKKRSNFRERRYIDWLSIYFIDKTIEYCNKNNLTLIFMCPPQHNKCFLDSIYYKQIYKEKYSDIPFYDFRDLQLPDSCFGDLDHLNYKGAKVFSEYLEKEVLHKQNYIQQQ